MSEPALKLATQEEELTREVVSIESQAKALKIVDSPSYLSAGELWKSIKDIRKKVADFCDPGIKQAHELHKTLVAKKKEADTPLDNAERIVKRAMSDYDAEQERLRREEQRRLEEIARKEEEERRLQEAIAAEEEARRNGATKEVAAQEAAAIIDEPVYVAPVVIPKTVPKMQGGPVYRTIWKFRIKDVNLIPRQYMMPNEVAIGAVVRSLKNQANIPGVEAYEDRV